MFEFIRTHPGVLISLALLAGGAFVCTVIGLLMARAGASLRPISWFAGLFALIVVPQFIGHCYRALSAAKVEAPRAAALQQVASMTNSTDRGDGAKTLFGPDADPQLITDVRHAYGDVFASAELAQFAVLPNGDTALLARFHNSAAAEKAWVDYLRVSGLNQGKGKGDSQRGYAVTRPVGDRAYVLHFGNMVGIWTGKNNEAVRQRMTASGFEIPRFAPLDDASATQVSDDRNATPAPSRPQRPLRTALIAVSLAAYVGIVVLYYFKGAAWAGTHRAKAGTRPLPASELRSRLERINDLDVPFRIERGAQAHDFIATWRYADAKWVDLARARGLKRTFRIRLVLDEKSSTVRATDYLASFDWSAGRGGAELEWKAALGIVFFQYEHQRVFGLQLDEQGRFKPELSYAYTFNLQEMKSPLVEAVTQAGWRWRPTIWQGPTWLRWLTE